MKKEKEIGRWRGGKQWKENKSIKTELNIFKKGGAQYGLDSVNLSADALVSRECVHGVTVIAVRKRMFLSHYRMIALEKTWIMLLFP